YIQGHWAAATAVAALIECHRSGFGQVVTVGGVHGVMVSCAGQLTVVPDQLPLPTNVGPGGRHPCYTTYRAGDGLWLFLAALTPKFQTNAFKVLEVGDIFADQRIRGVPARMLLPENRGWIRQRLADAFRTRPRDEWLARLEAGDCPAGPVDERDHWLDHPQIHANGLRHEVLDPERGPVVMPGVPLVMTESPGSIRMPAPRLGQHDQSFRPWPRRPTGSGVPTTSPRGPLAGYRVLDVGTILAGPYAGALLAELGADVIKVEAPVGDPFRETGFIYNRGQRGLAIDLSTPASREAFYALVRTADVVVDNARLGVTERLRIDYANLEQVKPDIITLSISGFGQDGSLAAKPGFDPVLQAMSGMMRAQGGECDPVLFTIPINDVAAATLAVLGVCMGIFHRERSGAGQKVWTSLLGCATIMQSGELVRFEGRTPPVRGGCDFGGPSALERFYRLEDGWVRIQAPDVAGLQAAGVLGVVSPGISDATLSAAIAESLASRRVAEVTACLTAAGVPVAPARTPDDLPVDSHLCDLHMFATQTMRDGTPFYVTNRYARFSRTEEQVVFRTPGVGEHSRAVLTEAGVAAADIDALIASGHLKQGEPFQVVAIQNYR
ncbi:MAG TPA: CoA transferase, partial [Chloroflexota bacterium]